MKRAWAALTAAAAALELLSHAGTTNALAAQLREAVKSGRLATATLTLELGVPASAAAESGEAAPEGTETPQEQETDEPAAETMSEPAPEPTPAPTPEPTPAPEAAPEATPAPGTAAEPQTADFPGGMVTNRTGYAVDTDALLAESMDIHLQAGAPQILVIHTHGTEAYTCDSQDRYEASDEYRTTDTSFNVVRVGDALCEELTAQGLNVVHDRGLYDYPSYTGSYSRSEAAVENWLAQYPGIAVVIDLHRDALGEGDAIYKTRAALSGEASAQVMLLVGTGENGLDHPHWRENFKLALHMKSAMDQLYPTLARPIDLVSERYNQHLTNGSLLVEVGSSGNTLAEALCAVRLFARAVGPVLSSLAETPV